MCVFFCFNYVLRTEPGSCGGYSVLLALFLLVKTKNDTIFDYIVRACDLVTLASTLWWHCDSTDDDIEIISRASEMVHAMADAIAAEKSGDNEPAGPNHKACAGRAAVQL